MGILRELAANRAYISANGHAMLLIHARAAFIGWGGGFIDMARGQMNPTHHKKVSTYGKGSGPTEARYCGPAGVLDGGAALEG